MKDLPNIAGEINKKYKTIKVTTLDRAASFNLQRFFSGSFGVNHVTGGGFAYRRLQLLFGARSAGKNALLNQMTAYNQRLCRNCQGVHPEFWDRVSQDMWAGVMVNILGIKKCECDDPTHKIIHVFDYERNLALEKAKTRVHNKITNKKTNEEVDELDYNDACAALEELSALETVTDEQKAKIKSLEKFLDSVKVETYVVNAMDTADYLHKCGILSDKLLVSDPDDVEEGIDMVKDIIRSRQVDVIIWDSLQAAVPRYVKDRDADQATMGVEAKQNGLLMRQVSSAYAAANLEDEKEAFKPAFFMTSQVRSSIGGFVSGPDTYSGGNAVQHHISLALELKREHFLRADGTKADFKDDLYGQKIRLRAEKNKLSAPGSVYEMDYYFRDGATYPVGIDYISEIVSLGVKVGLIERAGPYYAVNGEKFQGMQKMVEYFRENPTFVGELYSKL